MIVYRAIVWAEDTRPLSYPERKKALGAPRYHEDRIETIGTFPGTDIRALAASDPHKLSARVLIAGTELDLTRFSDKPHTLRDQPKP